MLLPPSHVGRTAHTSRRRVLADSVDTLQELEERSLFTRSGLTRLVDRIEAAGLVRREPVPGDRRGVRVVLTPEGRRLTTLRSWSTFASSSVSSAVG
jgi:Transcriptional regulators